MQEILLASLVLLLGIVAWVRFREGKEEVTPEGDPEDEDRARELTAFWLSLKDHFPYLLTPSIKDTTSESIASGIAEIFADSQEYGWAPRFNYLPVPALPPKARRRHLYVMGKTGSGKSTFLEHLITDDLSRGRGVAVISPEGEFFRDRLLSFVPGERQSDVIYLAPAHEENRITFNPLAIEPGDDAIQAADDLFGILKSIFQDDSLGARMKPLLQNMLAALVGQRGVTLFDIKRLVDDEHFRSEVLRDADSYVRDFWLETYPRYPKGAAVPIVNRLDRFLRTPKLRRTLCNPAPGLSIRRALAENKILFLDLFGLNDEQLLLMGQLLLSKFQLELLRREVSGSDAQPYFVYCDEFQSFAGMSPGLWRALLSRGRKYGLALTLANQYPGQLPAGLRDEIFGNVNSLVAFELGAGDANVVRRELLQREVTKGKSELVPVPAVDLLDLSIGEAVVKLGGGKAVQIETLPPLAIERETARAVARRSWQRYGSPEIERAAATLPQPPAAYQSAEPPLPVEAPKSEAVVPATPPREIEAPPAPSTPGRGGPEHTYLQELVKRWGEKRGFRATIEREVPGGGRADVGLEREGKRIACEIAVTTSAEHELGNIRKCLAAEFDHAVVVSRRKRFLRELERRAEDEFSEDERTRVHFLSPETFIAFLDSQAAEDDTDTIAGYKVKVSYREPDKVEDRARRRAVKDVIRKSLSRLEK